jgi:AICAR transformylase/IMP cyclohydrolase PurH
MRRGNACKPFAEPACVIVKHANPCGAAIAATPLDAYRAAFATDPTAAFGGIIAFNREVDASVVEAVCEQFLEVLIAPGYAPDALAKIARKTNVRVLAVQPAAGAPARSQTSTPARGALLANGGSTMISPRPSSMSSRKARRRRSFPT